MGGQSSTKEHSAPAKSNALPASSGGAPPKRGPSLERDPLMLLVRTYVNLR